MAIESKIKDGIGLIGLNRPEKANAYDKAHLTMIQEAFRGLAEQCEVIAFHSLHSGAFCAGADLDEMSDATPKDAENLFSQAVFTEIARSPVVSIAVVNGAAVAGGFELALATDLRVVGPRALFRLPETSLGIIPAAGGSTRLTGLLGASIAKQVILGGRTISSADAVTWGLGVAAEGDPLAFGLKWAEAIQGHPEATAAAKRIVNAAAEDRSLADERTAQARLYANRIQR